jgi:hypothetical protein
MVVIMIIIMMEKTGKMKEKKIIMIKRMKKRGSDATFDTNCK